MLKLVLVRTQIINRRTMCDKPVITKIEDARNFMISCFCAVGTPKKNAEICADNLIEADTRGHYSHGMNRLEMYIRDIQTHSVDPKAEPKIDKETAATALISGNKSLGAVIGKFAMDVAIKKALDVGIGITVAHGSNHYGIAGMYTLQAVDKGLIGFTCSNTAPLMVPTRAKKAALGTNPLSFGAPALDGDSFLLDMATTGVALGKIEVAKRKGVPIPAGWAQNEDGQVETNAEKAAAAKCLMPLGGTEVNAGYKGYGLGLMVEVLCGILGDSLYGPNIPKFGSQGSVFNLGHCFIAINPECFAPCFQHRLSDLLDTLREIEPVDKSLPVIVAGDPERLHREKVKKQGGLTYVKDQHESNAKLAAELKVEWKK